MGGEKASTPELAELPEGSPPHGRGKENIPGPQLGAERITPAWAGKRSRNMACTKSGRDHPRMGGEKRTAAVLSRPV